MLKIQADLVYTLAGEPIKNGLIFIKNDFIEEVIDPLKTSYHSDDVMIYKGAICPGFFNAHCHLELSHLLGKILQQKGLPEFVQSIKNQPFFSFEEIDRAMEHAIESMQKEGIVWVGDISNNASSFKLKAKSNLNFYTFIELIGFNTSQSDQKINDGLLLQEMYEKTFSEKSKKTFVALTPHAPYSTSLLLMQKIAQISENKQTILSIHNQETPSENELFLLGKGKMADFLTSLQLDVKSSISGKNSLQTYLPSLQNSFRLLLVHNTFTTKKDIDWVKKLQADVFWCFCPRANLYIENKLPDLNLFRDEKCVMGTDSLASNFSLSILEELKCLQDNFPSLTTEKLLTWACKNGAELFQQNNLGQISKGKRAKLNLIQHFDVEQQKFTKESKIQVLL